MQDLKNKESRRGDSTMDDLNAGIIDREKLPSELCRGEGTKTADDLVRVLAERGLPAGRGGLLVWIWILAAPLFGLAGLAALGSGEVSYVCLFLTCALTSRVITRLSGYARDARAALLLPELDREWLGALMDGLAYPSGYVRDMARLRLTTVLPILKDVDPESLSPGRRGLLFDNLNPWTAHADPDLVIAVLEFGASIGDEHALAGTDRLASMRAFSFNLLRVRNAARRCLLPLEEKVAARLGAEDARAESMADARPEERQLSEEAKAWLAEVEAESAKSPGMRFGFLLASWGVIVPYLLYQVVNQIVAGNLPLTLLFAALAGGASQAHRFALTPQQMKLASKLGSVDNLEAVGPLAEMTAWPDARLRSMAIAALTRLLPRLKSSDTQLLSVVQRTILYDWLKLEHSRSHAEFQVAMLTALEQIGDLAAVPRVQALAVEVPLNVRQKRVVEAARNCLPYLAGCAHQNRQSQVLLRAISDDSADASLLRPAPQFTDLHPERLVRVANSSESS
jgi:hypothetical protein